MERREFDDYNEEKKKQACKLKGSFKDNHHTEIVT